MKPKYVQLPPLPLDLPLESIEMIWMYARIPEQERIVLRDFLRDSVSGNTKNLNKTAFAEMIRDDNTELNSDVVEYIELMKNLLGTLMSQACEIEGLVYMNYCIEGKSIKKILKSLIWRKKFYGL